MTDTEVSRPPEMRTHELKTWTQYFRAILSGEKTFELRKNDRDFRVGDVLVLREFDPIVLGYTGRSVTRNVTYVLHGIDWQRALARDYCVLGLSSGELRVFNPATEIVVPREDAEKIHARLRYLDGVTRVYTPIDNSAYLEITSRWLTPPSEGDKP